MVKFGKHLLASHKSNWQEHYVDYEHLRDAINCGSRCIFQERWLAEMQQSSLFFHDASLTFFSDLYAPSQAQEGDTSPEMLQVRARDLLNFAELNSEALRKAAKKFDKRWHQDDRPATATAMRNFTMPLLLTSKFCGRCALSEYEPDTLVSCRARACALS